MLKGTDGTTLVPPLFWLGRIPWASARLNWTAIVGDETRVNPSAKSAGVVEEDSTGAAAVVAAKADIANAVSPAHRIVIGVIVRYWLPHGREREYYNKRLAAGAALSRQARVPCSRHAGSVRACRFSILGIGPRGALIICDVASPPICACCSWAAVASDQSQSCMSRTSQHLAVLSVSGWVLLRSAGAMP